MKLEEQVVSLELAKKLKELEVKQESLYYWDENDKEVYRSIDRSAKDIGCISAFTVAELGEILPIGYHNIRITDTFDKARYVCRKDRVDAPWNQYADTEANARAKMLVYLLIENKFLHGKVE